MVTMAQRLGALRTGRGLSCPALSAALGFPRTAIEKFESGRQTPTQDQQRKLADYFGVTLPYLRGESDDPAEGDSWLAGGVPEEEPVRGMKLEKEPESMSEKELMKLIMEVQKKMQRAAAELDFEQAAVLRDQMMELKKYLYEMDK